MAKTLNSAMEWTEQHDVFLCREVLVVDLFKTKKKTTHRAELWKKIADNLNGYDNPKFNVSQRAVRDRYGNITTKYKKKMNEEEKASGIQPQHTELDALLEEILEREKLAEEECDEVKKKTEDEKIKAVDIRRTAMESLSQTKKRKLNEGTSTTATKSRRSSGSEAIEYLKERGQQQLRLQEQELELKKQQQEAESIKNAATVERHESMMQMMATQQQQMLQQIQHQQQQQQQQANNFQVAMAQQTQLLSGLVEKLIHK